MKIKQLKRRHPKAWAARMKTAAARRISRAVARLNLKAFQECGPDWGRVEIEDHDKPGGPMFCCLWVKRGEEPKPVPQGEPIVDVQKGEP